jgi:toxin ParE1/3/4
MNYEFHPEALAEFEDAAVHYAEKQPGLELRFIASIEAVISRIVEEPEIFALLEQDVRRCLARVFPYAVLYTIEPEYILIVAVMHCHRKPGYWRRRITV